MITLIGDQRKTLTIFLKLDKAGEMASTIGMERRRIAEVALGAWVDKGGEDFQGRARDRLLLALRIQRKPNRKKCKFTQTNLS